MATLFLYIDESGDLGFKSQSSRYFVVTCVAARRPFRSVHKLIDLKYDLMEQGLFFEKFHACEDSSPVRAQVYSVMRDHLEDYAIYSAFVSKPMLPKDEKNPAAIYSMAFSWLIGIVYEKECGTDIDTAIVVTDSLPKDAVKAHVRGPLKSCMKKNFQNAGIHYYLEHKPSNSDMNLQIADYACWAVHRMLTRGATWPLNVINDAVRDIQIVDIKKQEAEASCPTPQPISEEEPLGLVSAGGNVCEDGGQEPPPDAA